MFGLTRRCPFHDAPSARRIAQLEAELGIDPDAMLKYQAVASDFVESHADPDLIDCGRRRCRERREAL